MALLVSSVHVLFLYITFDLFFGMLVRNRIQNLVSNGSVCGICDIASTVISGNIVKSISGPKYGFCCIA